jgi:hypothetical protein
MKENKYDTRWEWVSRNSIIYPHLYDNTTKRMLIDMKTWTRKDNEKWNQTSLISDVCLMDGNTVSTASSSLGRPERAIVYYFQFLCHLFLTYLSSSMDIGFSHEVHPIQLTMI